MSKVAIVRCADYDRTRVSEAVKKAVDLIGGIASFVKPGMQVLLKPNLLSPRLPEEGVDTHPEVVRAVARLVKSVGARPIIGDSPGGYGKNVNEVFEMSGMKQVAHDEGVELVKFTTSRFVDGIPISRYIFDSNCIISIPKFKTHSVTMLTAAIKNTFGTITGLYKAECHSRAPKEKEFAKIIAKVHSISKPHLNILDGIMAMEGDGPSMGEMRNMKMIMASVDAVAIDSCIAKIIGLEPRDILVTKEAYDMGLGEADMSRIEIVGDDIKSFSVSDFKFPQTIPIGLLPRAVTDTIASFIRFKPYIDNDICKKCNLCKLSCPVNAITADKDFYKINYKICIRCMCCHEVCPYKAISIKRNILTKMIWG